MAKPPKKPDPVPGPPVKFTCITCGRSYKEIDQALNCTHGKLGNRVKLNLGCGTRLMAGYVNVDHHPFPGIDELFDVDNPWPWDNESATEVYARDLFEHVNDPVWFVTEAHRVLVVGGLLIVIVPDYRSPDAFSDPTHRRFCTPQTFNHWVPGTAQYQENNYGGVAFAADNFLHDPRTGKLKFVLRKIRNED